MHIIQFILLWILTDSISARCQWPSFKKDHNEISPNEDFMLIKWDEVDFEEKCREWGLEIGVNTELGHVILQKRHWHAVKLHSSCAFAYGRRLSNRKWEMHVCQPEKQCYNPNHGRSLPFGKWGPCSPLNSPDSILGWKDESAHWRIKNQGHGLEITFSGGSMWTKIIYNGKEDRLKVEKILVTTDGSQHVTGSRRQKAELQIYHEEHPHIGRQAFAFFIMTRHVAYDNVQWGRLFTNTRSKSHYNSIGYDRKCKRKPNLQNLIFERDTRIRSRLRHFTRYKDPADGLCGNYMWTVFDTKIFISLRQFLNLQKSEAFRAIRQPQTMTLPLEYCKSGT